MKKNVVILEISEDMLNDKQKNGQTSELEKKVLFSTYNLSESDRNDSVNSYL